MRNIKKIVTLGCIAVCAAVMLCSCGNKKALASISLASPITLQLGESKEVEITGILRDGTTVTGDELDAILKRKGMHYESSSDNVASIDQNGLLTANNSGTTEISITSQNKRLTAGAVVNVVEPLQGFQAEDGTGAVVPVDAAETFQYDGKSLSFEKDGATYIVRMVADSYTGAAQYAEEQTDESFTVSGMRFAGNGQELVVVGTRSAGDDEGNAAVRTAVADMLEKAVPAQGSGNITLNGVAVTTDGCEASFSNGLALVKNGDGEVKFTPSSYDSETIAFDDAGTTASGAAVTHSDYANVNDTEAYLIESDEGNVMAFTNNADLLTSVLGLQ